MTPTTLRRVAAAVLLALPFLPLLAGCDTEDGTGAEATVTVMTRNLYLGADLFALLDPSCAGDAIAGCVYQLYFGSVVQSDVAGRMAAIAEEIEANAPDLVGLQEVSLYRTQSPSDYVTGTTTPNASTVAYDFLQLLLDALEARGLAYEVVAETENADVEFPATNNGTTFTDIRLTDRDVILARGDAFSSIEVRTEANFAVAAPIEIGGVTVEFTRGYNAVDVVKDGVPFTFANTHLEVGGDAAPVQRLQAQFLASPGGFGDVEPLILVGDFNANPETESDPDLADAYQTLVAEFEDAWADLRPSDDGFTCCQAADLMNDASELSERIDLILYQGDVTPVSVGVVGNDPDEQTAGTGLWPSDHAGVVATLVVQD